jgi:uncharacterized protein
MRATLDTNVFVSALNFGGVPAQILDLHTDEMFIVCASPAIIAELTRVLAARFEWTEEDIESTLTPIFSRAEMVEPTVTVSTSPDPDDNHILECALEAKCDVIVTGDQGLLNLGSFEGISIMPPRDFFEHVLRSK